jgi:hypothetical protein
MATQQKQLGSGKAQFTEVPPNAARTMAALREMGYDSFAAIMDLVDNSLDAGAKNVDISIKEAGSKSVVIDIGDDGDGMDDARLAEALRLGSDTEHNAKKDLGKFGMGLVTASISMARRVWVLTRKEGKVAYEATFDLGTIERQNKFVIQLKASENSRRVLDLVGDHGTLVRLEEIDRIGDTNVSRFASVLREKLGRVYRHFLAAGVKISVNNRKVARLDPLMLDHPQTEVVLDTTIDLHDGTRAKLKIVELPDLGQGGDAEAGIYPHNSGFYVVRNNREIIAGETFSFYRHHHSYSHFRAELSYHGNSTAFHEDIKKASIHPDERVLNKLRQVTEKYIVQSGRKGRDRADAAPLNMSTKAAEETINTVLAAKLGNEQPAKAGEPPKKEGGKAEATNGTPRVRFAEMPLEARGRIAGSEQKDGEMVVYYNTKHPLVRLVSDLKQRQAQTILGWVAFAMAQVEQEMPELTQMKVADRFGDILATLAAPGK